MIQNNSIHEVAKNSDTQVCCTRDVTLLFDNLYSQKSSVEWSKQTESKTNNKPELYKHN